MKLLSTPTPPHSLIYFDASKDPKIIDPRLVSRTPSISIPKPKKMCISF